MNLRDLEYAVCLAGEGQFRRAATRCHVSQPTLSAQIAKLEDELGVQLFERGPRSATATVNGRALIRQAQIVLDEVERLKALARAGQDPLQGPFHLGVIPTAGPYLLPLLLPVLRQRWPRLQLLLREELTAGLLERLRVASVETHLVASAAGVLNVHHELGLDRKALAETAARALHEVGLPTDTDFQATLIIDVQAKIGIEQLLGAGFYPTVWPVGAVRAK